MKKKWAKKFKWQSKVSSPQGNLISEEEANQTLSKLVKVGDRLSLEMMRQMVLGLSDPEFCRIQATWNQFLLTHQEKDQDPDS